MLPTETPARIWRRIQETEDREIPSLPSFPAFSDDSLDHDQFTEGDAQPDSIMDDDSLLSSPIQSTPMQPSTNNTLRPPSSATSTARFANSIASRSSKTSFASQSTKSSTGLQFSRGLSMRSSRKEDSFEASVIAPMGSLNSGDVSGDSAAGRDLPVKETYSDKASFTSQAIRSRSFSSGPVRRGDLGASGTVAKAEISQDSVPDVYLPPMEDPTGYSLTEALESVSRSPSPVRDSTPRKPGYFENNTSVKSEPRVRLLRISLYKPKACSSRHHMINFGMSHSEDLLYGLAHHPSRGPLHHLCHPQQTLHLTAPDL